MNIGKYMVKSKKAQIVEELFKYILVGVVAVIILVIGYVSINAVKDRACKTEIGKFEIDLRNLDKSLRFGTKEMRSYDAPCNVDRIYFFDLNKKISPENFKDIPLLKDTLESGGNNNVFLVKEGEVKRSFYAGNLEIEQPYYLCFIPKFSKISFFIEDAGAPVRMASASDNSGCT